MCLYDFPGTGYSPSGPTPRSRDRVVDEIRAGLVASGRNGPYALVTTGLGGNFAMSFALKCAHP